MEQFGTIDPIAIEALNKPIEKKRKGKKASFSWFSKHWVDTYARPNNKPSEIKNKVSAIRVHLYPFFQDQDIRTITTEQIEQLIGLKISEGLAKSSVNHYLTVLRTMLTKAVDWGYLEKSPMDRVKQLKLDQRDPGFYSEEELQKFLKGIKEHFPEHYPFFLTAFSTGMRHGELRALQWKDIDFERGIIRVSRTLWRKEAGTPKGRRARNIPMHSVLKNTLHEHRKSRKSRVLVFSLPDGSPYGINAGRKSMKKVCKLEGIKCLRFHDIRHTFASQMVMKGQSLRVIKEIMGHADISTTMIYAHLAPEFTARSVECLVFDDGQKVGQVLVKHQITDQYSDNAIKEKPCNIS